MHGSTDSKERTAVSQKPLTISTFGARLSTFAAWLLAVLWIMPLLYAMWAAFHPSEFATKLVLDAPLTFENFIAAFMILEIF